MIKSVGKVKEKIPLGLCNTRLVTPPRGGNAEELFRKISHVKLGGSTTSPQFHG